MARCFSKILAGIAVILFTTLIAGSCKKSSTSKPNTIDSSASFDFSYYGSLIADDTIIFYNTAPQSTSSFLWDFGDGSESPNSTTGHIYKLDGTYTVKLIINNDSANSIQKQLVITPPAICKNTSLMGGVRNWHHYVMPYSTSIYSQPTDTLNDTSFAVQIIGEMLVRFGDTSFRYFGFESSGIYTSLNFTSVNPYIYFGTSELSYYLNDNSIVIRLYQYQGNSITYETF